jgi:hypothetical protein
MVRPVDGLDDEAEGLAEHHAVTWLQQMGIGGRAGAHRRVRRRCAAVRAGQPRDVRADAGRAMNAF